MAMEMENVPFGNQTWQWKSPIREVLLWEKRL